MTKYINPYKRGRPRENLVTIPYMYMTISESDILELGHVSASIAMCMWLYQNMFSHCFPWDYPLISIIKL